jgi:molecular chaperone GrpE
MPERDKKLPEENANAEAPAEAGTMAEPETAAEAATQAASQAEVEGSADPTAVLKAEIASLKDQLLRALAETENLRRRSRRERDDALKYAAVPFIRDLVGATDNLRRAMDSVSSEALEADGHLKTLMAGLEMTETELATVFERHHIVKIDPLGARLDPHNHEAMFEVPDTETPSGTVVQVIQPGYRLHDRLLRPAQVGVAKGGPAAEPQAPMQEASPPRPEPQSEAKSAGNDDQDPPGSTVDTPV